MFPIKIVFSALIVATLSGTALAHDGPIASAPPIERDAWIKMGKQVHGGFGSLIALGIRLGDDAMKRLSAGPRDLDVTFYSSKNAPCACVADGILIAVSASPGQGTLRVSPDMADEGLFARIEFKNRKNGQQAEYKIPIAIWPTLRDLNKRTEIERWDGVMALKDDELFILAH